MMKFDCISFAFSPVFPCLLWTVFFGQKLDIISFLYDFEGEETQFEAFGCGLSGLIIKCLFVNEVVPH